MRGIFFYRKETPYLIGYVADFCPIEREIKTCAISAVHSSGYLSFACIIKGDLLRRDRRCCSCGIVIPDEKAAYIGMVSDRHTQSRVLEEKTNPDVFERHRGLIELHRRIESGLPVDEELKRSLLKEQFLWLEQIAAQVWTSETKLDQFSALSAILSFVVWLTVLVAVTKTVQEGRRLDAIGWVFGFGLVLLVFSAAIFFLAPRRSVGKRVVPLLAAALRPLNPSKSDIETVLSQMRAEGFRYSTRVPINRIMEELQC